MVLKAVKLKKGGYKILNTDNRTVFKKISANFTDELYVEIEKYYYIKNMIDFNNISLIECEKLQ